MSTLEDLVRRSLADHEQAAPSAERLAGRVIRARRRRKQRGLAGVAAVSVVAVVVGLTLTGGGSSTSTPRPAVSPPPPVPVGMQAIGYRGVEMFVPSTFHESRCGGFPEVFAVGDVSTGTIDCEGSGVTTRTWVNIHAVGLDGSQQSDEASAVIPTTVDGEPAHRGIVRYGVPSDPHELEVLVLDKQQLLIEVFDADPARRAALLSTVHVLDRVDRSGCAIQVHDLDRPATTRTGSDLVPGDPTSISVCSYADYWIRDSRVLIGADLRSLVTALNQLPPGISRAKHPTPGFTRCPELERQGVLLVISYPDRVLREVARIERCGDFYIGDQHGTGQIAHGITGVLMRGLSHDHLYAGSNALEPG